MFDKLSQNCLKRGTPRQKPSITGGVPINTPKTRL